MDAHEIELGDLRLLAGSDSPDLAGAVIAFIEQSDPEPEKVPEGAFTVSQLSSTLRSSALEWKPRNQRRKEAHAAWTRFLSQPDLPPPPRFALAALLVEMYHKGSDAGRAALVHIAREATLRFGMWAGLKRIYKLSEERLDAEMFGVLAWRFDKEASSSRSCEVTQATLVYLRRRAWRFLRHLGAQVPELYPQFAVQVLRHYEDGVRPGQAFILSHVLCGDSRKNFTPYRFTGKLPDDLLKHRAFPDAWKRSADPLLFLLETCQADPPARFAIQGLRKDFPEKLRGATPAWLARLSLRPLSGVHEFLVETLQASPDLHQGKLRDLGLHDTVLSLLTSPSAKARAYAIEYARAHAQDLEPGRLADLLLADYKDTKTFAAAALSGRDPRALGVVFLGRLLDYDETAKWADKSLNESFERGELSEGFLIDMLYGGDERHDWADKYLKKKYRPGELGAAFWRKVLDDPRLTENRWEHEHAMELATEALSKYPLAEVGAAWLLSAVVREDIGETVSEWLRKAESLPGLDVERIKGLVFNSRYRALALQLLQNTKLVRPRDLTLPWLLALARRADPTLHEFAHRYLLQHMKAEDFSEAGDKEGGIARLFALATGKNDKEPEPVRVFAQTYLRCHHPGIGAEQPEAKALHLSPQLPRAAYTAERIWPALFDTRADVRRFALSITRADLRRWGYHTRVYDLAESDAKEVRNLAYDATLKAGEPGADLAVTLKPDELDPGRIFAFTESRKRSTREVGMELIRRHYGRLGGAERLAWLMESPDREVRLFSVRILWEKHRPTHLPPGWRPTAHKGKVLDLTPASDGPAGRFADVEALRAFLRRVLFGLPPGRSMEPRDDGGPRRHIPASEAKRNVIEMVRDLGEKDAAFAHLVAPVLSEFTGSLARGEWQACLAALSRLRHAHPGLAVGTGEQG